MPLQSTRIRGNAMFICEQSRGPQRLAARVAEAPSARTTVGTWPIREGYCTLTFSARGPFGPCPTVNETACPSRRLSNGVLAQAD